MKKIALFLFISFELFSQILPKIAPNIIWLDLEDISPIMPMYGDSTISIPHIEQLSKESIVYQKAYACAGVCAPSRASIATGMHPIAIGAQHMRIQSPNPFASKGIPEYEVVPTANVRCFMDILRENGVFTSNSKKTDYNFSPSPFSWDEYLKNDEVDRYTFPKQKPFFKQINFWETHESQIWSWCRTNIPLLIDSSKVRVPPYLPNSKTMRGDWIAQYNHLKFVDEKIGKIIQKLKDEKLYDNTIIILTGDHGTGLPRSKRTVYESGVRVPLLIRIPKYTSNPIYNSDLVYLMDLGPTILSFYSLSTPKNMHGINIFNSEIKNRKYAFASADRFDESYDMIRACTDGKFRYIRNFNPQLPQFINNSFRKNQAGVRELYLLDSLNLLDEIQKSVMRKTKPREELYLLENDPFEINNLAENPLYIQKLEEMRKALNDWQLEMNDWGFVQEKAQSETFWKGNKMPQTSKPNIQIDKSKVLLETSTPGASIGYKFKKSDVWKIYSKSFEIKVGDSLYVIAHRLGYKTSDEISIKIKK